MSQNPSDHFGDVAIQQLKSLGHEKLFKRGEYILHEGDTADCFYLITSGSVVVFLEEEDGEVVLAYLNEGEIFGEVPINPESRERSASVRTRTDTTVCRIDFNSFIQLASRNHELWLIIIRQLSRQLRYSSHKVKLLARMTTKQRIQHMLKELRKLPGARHDSKGSEIRVTREELGSIAGCTREMAGRVLRELSDAGEIELRGHKIWISADALS